MTNLFICFYIFVPSIITLSQSYNTANIHAHNDYLNTVPFYNAFNHNVGSIEADIYLVNNNLLVAHEPYEIDSSKKLSDMYLQPLQKMIKKHGGKIYPSNQPLIFLVDLKTDGKTTLSQLIRQLQNYPEIINCKTLKITISGSVPDTSLWHTYPDYIHFDGRPYNI